MFSKFKFLKKPVTQTFTLVQRSDESDEDFDRRYDIEEKAYFASSESPSDHTTQHPVYTRGYGLG